MLEKLRQRSASDEGFTLVELLVVMLILGILAAIAIPAFFSQRDKAKDADAKSLVRTAQTAAEAYGSDRNGLYTAMDEAALKVIEPTIDTTKVDANPTATAKGYTIVATSGTNNTFSINRSDTGAVSYPCVGTGNPSAGCPSTNIWKP